MKLSSSKNESSIIRSYINKISGRGKCNPVFGVEANNFQKYLADKIESVKKSLSENMTPRFSYCNPGIKLDEFAKVDEDEVIQTIGKLHNKQCALNPIPTWLLKKISRLIVLFLKLFSTVFFF